MNKITIKVVNVVNGVYQIHVSGAEAVRDLSAADYDKFNPTMEFAGLSKRGIMLSKPKSTGPAEISGFPLVQNPDETIWQTCEATGPLVSTNKPEIIVTVNEVAWGKPVALVKMSQLIPRYAIIEHYYNKEAYPDKDYVTTTEPSVALNFYTAHQAVKLLHDRNTFYIQFPSGYSFTKEEWLKVDRHIITGKPTATNEEVVPIEGGAVFWFAGEQASVVCAKYGIKGKPACYNKGQLGFRVIEICDPSKAKSAYQALEKLTHINAGTYGSYGTKSVYLEDVLQNPLLCKSELSVSGDFSTVRVGVDMTCSKLTYPVRCYKGTDEEHEALVFGDGTGKDSDKAQAFAEKFFVPVMDICRTHVLDEKTIRYNLRFAHRAYLPGKWVLKSDAIKLSLRNNKEERTKRLSRVQALEAKYGPLPKGLSKHKDEDIDTYFAIQQGLSAGEYILAEESTMLPEHHYGQRQTAVEWLKKNGFVKTCPLTGQEYVKHFGSFDDLVAIPDFMDMVEEMFHQRVWLTKLLASSKAQALAVTELI